MRKTTCAGVHQFATYGTNALPHAARGVAFMRRSCGAQQSRHRVIQTMAYGPLREGRASVCATFAFSVVSPRWPSVSDLMGGHAFTIGMDECP